MSLATLHNRIESRIAQALISEILVRGFTVSINDGDDEVISKSTNEKAILKVMANTDEDTVLFYKANSTIVGGIVLAYGEAECLITDYSGNLVTAQIVERSKKIALA